MTSHRNVVTTKSAVMFGAGNVGRGFLGQLFSESGYEVVFVDIDGPLISALNARRAYSIRLVENDRAEEATVCPVRALYADQREAVTRALAEADIGATAVGVRALPQVAPLIAAGVARRAESGVEEPLNIIVCENMKDAADALRHMVGEHLPEDRRPYLQARVGFVDAVIGRMVPPPTSDMRARDPSFILVEPYKELPVNRHGFVGPIPEIVGLEPCENFEFYTARKLYIHNCGHAMLGYLGHLRGHAFGYQALADPAIRPLFERALAESRDGILAAYGAEADRLDAHIVDVIRRLANQALGDTVFRLARDPLRKLGPEDRLVGAARLAQRAGTQPKALSWGIAAGYYFDHPEDPLAVELQQRIAGGGFETALAAVSGIQADEPLAGLVQEQYGRLRKGMWT